MFCSKYQFKPELTLTLNTNNILVEHVCETNVLGVTFDHNLSWSKQIDTVVGKMGRGVSVVKRISKIPSPDVRRQVLNALVLSQLDYCLVIRSNTSVHNLRKLQVAQNRAARCALFCSYRTNVSSMYDSLG